MIAGTAPGGGECHGTLWILDALVDAGILTGPRAAESLRTMQANNRWLPKAECDARVKSGTCRKMGSRDRCRYIVQTAIGRKIRP
ncbi:DUF3368 domain-containing protein [Methanoculleus sp. FWC-SCC3]|uniref:DUF3368 domain-containing protein n=1 Tax=Methanoculleus methanifontis TaxID=2584086 RepID=A0ABT8M129_9EURY|nr:DUF3368 domain-containing protein [Methanoculleus sp. FWC-SCC3]